MIEVKDIKKAFKDKVIFEGINFEFKEGNIYHIKGYNGSGKSVLLKMLCGFSLPDDGEIIIDGCQLGKEMDFINDAGVSINNDEFISYLSGYDNLKLLLNIRKKVSANEIDTYAKMFELEKDINKTAYKAYSQGMKQKLRLIQALIEKPKYLILDEPTNALDIKAIETLKSILINFISDKSKIVIFVTHSDDVIADLANVIIEVENNKLNVIKDTKRV